MFECFKIHWQWMQSFYGISSEKLSHQIDHFDLLQKCPKLDLVQPQRKKKVIKFKFQKQPPWKYLSKLPLLLALELETDTSHSGGWKVSTGNFSTYCSFSSFERRDPWENWKPAENDSCSSATCEGVEHVTPYTALLRQICELELRPGRPRGQSQGKKERNEGPR